MAGSTREIFEIVAAEEKIYRATPDTSLDLSKAQQLQEDGSALTTPKTPVNSPRLRKTSEAKPGGSYPTSSPRDIVSPRSSSPRLSDSGQLKKSPRHLDLAQLAGRASPPREESIVDIEKVTRRLSISEGSDSVVTRKKSSGSFSGHFKVTKRDSLDSTADSKKSEDEKVVNLTVNASPRK